MVLETEIAAGAASTVQEFRLREFRRGKKNLVIRLGLADSSDPSRQNDIS
jgi:hypothetical protein